MTYIRTDSTRISDEALLSVREMIKNTYGEPFLPAEPNIYKSRKDRAGRPRGIRPTDITRRPEAIKASLTPRPVPPLPASSTTALSPAR